MWLLDKFLKAAIKQGRLDAERLKRYRKLIAEDAFNSSSLAERRARGRAFGKMVKDITKRKRSLSAAEYD